MPLHSAFDAADGTTVSANLVVPNPYISFVSTAGSQVTITGSGFGPTQGNGYVLLNNLNGIITSWSDTQIVVTMQPGTLSGNMYVHQGIDSNAYPFVSTWTVATPAIDSLSPNAGMVGDSITINGVNFGAVQGTSAVNLNGVLAAVSSWSNSSVVIQVPYGVTTGNNGEESFMCSVL